MSDLDPLVAAGLLDDGEPRQTPPSGSPTCYNCEAPLAGPYCGQCGQRDQPLRIPLHRFLGQSFVEFFGLDGRVWRTLWALCAKPGTLTRAFLSGRRQRYLRPLRVYLSTTLLFFFLLQLFDPVGRLEEFSTDGPAILDSTVTAAGYLAYLDGRIAEEDDEVLAYRATADSLRAALDSARAVLSAAPDSLRDELEDSVSILADDLDDTLDDLASADGSRDDRRLAWQRAQVAAYDPDSTILPSDVHRAAQLVIGDGNEVDINAPAWLSESRAISSFRNARTPQERNRAGAELARASIGKVPIVLFVLLPVFALFLKVLYIRNEWFYSEHLVHGLHTHAFTFVVFTAVAILLAAAPGEGWANGTGWAGTVANLLIAVGLPVYYLVSIKRVYGQGWIKSFLKTGVLLVAYGATLLVGGSVLAVLIAAFSG